MQKFTFAYYGEPKFKSPEEGAKYKEKWRAWVRGLGDALVNPGNPLGKPKTVSSRGVSDGWWVESLDRVFYRESRQHGCCS